MTNNLPSPFSWGSIELSQAVFVDRVPHATRHAIDEWLEYSDPQKSVDKLLERNPHIEHYSTPVNLMAVDGKNRQVSVYHPIGFLLLVMESGQAKAQSMKVAVAEFVWHFAGPREMTFKEELELMKLQRTLCNDISRNYDMATATENPMLPEIAKVTMLTHCAEFELNLHALDTLADSVGNPNRDLDDIGFSRLLSLVNARMWEQSRELRSLAERL